MNRRIPLLLVIIGLLLTFGIGAAIYRAVSRHDTEASKTSGIAQYDQDNGVMSRKDAAELARISNRVEHSGTITDPDLDWVLQLFDGPPLQDTPSKRELLQATILLHIYGLKTPTSYQSDKMLRAALPLLPSRTRGVRLHGVQLIYLSDNPQARIYVEPLIHDPDPQVSKTATMVINRANHSTP